MAVLTDRVVDLFALELHKDDQKCVSSLRVVASLGLESVT